MDVYNSSNQCLSGCITMLEEKDTKSTSNSRRKVLKAIGVGGVLAGTIPSSWTKPVVKSVILPAHAQTSQPEPEPECDFGGPCTTGMNVNIITAALQGGGGLYVLGDSAIPGCCVPDSNPEDNQGLLCEVIDNGSTIASELRPTAGGDCLDANATADGCFVSCSVFVPPNDNTLANGDSVTLKLTFNGNCVCSGVTTVT